MRTINLYSFDELTPEAQKNAFDSWYQSDHYSDWHHNNSDILYWEKDNLKEWIHADLPFLKIESLKNYRDNYITCNIDFQETQVSDVIENKDVFDKFFECSFSLKLKHIDLSLSEISSLERYIDTDYDTFSITKEELIAELGFFKYLKLARNYNIDLFIEDFETAITEAKKEILNIIETWASKKFDEAVDYFASEEYAKDHFLENGGCDNFEYLENGTIFN